MARLNRGLQDHGATDVKNDIAARALINNPRAVVQAITDTGGDWNEVMNKIQDWVQCVSWTPQ